MLSAVRILDVAPYALGFLLPPLLVWSTDTGGVLRWLLIVVLFAGVALCDAIVPSQSVAPSVADADHLDRRPEFRMLTWLCIPVHLALLLWALSTAAALEGAAWWALVISTGAIGGAVGITYAHELVHRTSALERALGEVLLVAVSYPHFTVAHVYGHHRHVATPLDPATARLGEGLYPFLVRSIVGGAHEAWRIERARLRRQGRPAWHRSNRCWRFGVSTAAVYGVGWLSYGDRGVWFLALQSLLAIVLLETINYVEHYGLLRREERAGRYEPCGLQHSWDSSHRVSNWLLINLARHADHHLTASRRYPALASQPRAPQLPAGYGAMLLLATVPPLWRRVMDPRVRQVRARHWQEA